eukprot:gene11972-13964_t
MFRRVNMPGHNTWQGNCSSGQLTQRGYKQHLDIGSKFRELYVDKYGLLSPTLDVSEIWIRSTDMPRTMQSVQAEISGMYPHEIGHLSSSVDVININTMDGQFENMLPLSGHCPVMSHIYDTVNGAQKHKEYMATKVTLQDQIFKALKITELPIYGWYSLVDLFYAHQCHDKDLPAGIDQSMVDQVYDISLWEYKYQLTFPELARLQMSSFVNDVVSNFRGKINGTINEKIMFFSGHDVTVLPFVNIFGFLDEIPPYASHVEMELWQDDVKGDDYLQFKYNGVVLILPGCKSAMCPVQTFFDITTFILAFMMNVALSQIDLSDEDSIDPVVYPLGE